MDLSSRGVTDEIQLGYHSDNLGEFFFICKLVPPLSKYLFYSILSKVCMILSQKMVSIPMFSRSVIMINTIWNH